MRISDWSSDVCSSDLVDHLEAVEVEEGERAAVTVTAGDGQFARHHGIEGAAVGQAGQVVAARQLFQLGNAVGLFGEALLAFGGGGQDLLDQLAIARIREVGRASWRERGGQDEEVWVVCGE